MRHARALIWTVVFGFGLVAAPVASATASGSISTIAGDPYASGAAVMLGQEPEAIALAPGGGLYVTDQASNSVREVSALGQEVAVADATIFAGDNSPSSYYQLNQPQALAVDSGGDVLMADTGDNRIILVAGADCSSNCPYGLTSTIKGDMYVVAGGYGTAGSFGDGGPAIAAELDQPAGLAVDSDDDLMIADSGNDRVRMIAASNCSSACPFGLARTAAGDIYTIAGTGVSGSTGDGSPGSIAKLTDPKGLAIDADGDLLIADMFNNRVRLVAASNCASACPFGLSAMTVGDIYTVAGNGTSGTAGDGGPATSAELGLPEGVTVDAPGDLLIADSGDDRVQLVAATDCSSNCPFGLSETTSGDIYTVAGNGTSGFLGDGSSARAAELDQPTDVAVDSGGDLVIADLGNGRVRLVAGADCSSGCPFGLASMTANDIYSVVGNGAFAISGNGGPATKAEIGYPAGVAYDASSDVLIAAESQVRLVAASDCSSSCPFALPSTVGGGIYDVAGSNTFGFSGDGGPADSAELDGPNQVALDAGGDLLIADGGNHRVRLVAGVDCASNCPFGLAAVTDGDIYTVAGNGTYGFSGDGGRATSAELYDPFGLAVDPEGDLLISDNVTNRVRLVAASSCASSCPFGLPSMTSGDIYTVAGDGTGGFSGDGGAATAAELDDPEGLALDADGDLLIADTANARVRLVAASDCSSSCPFGLASTTAGDIYTVAGAGITGQLGNGIRATSAGLSLIYGVAVDAGGDLLISDSGRNLVRLVAGSNCASTCPYGLSTITQGDIYTIAGTGVSGFAGDGGAAVSAEFATPGPLALDSSGDLLIGDIFNSRVRLVTGGPLGPPVSLSLSRAGAGSGSVSGGAISCPGVCSAAQSQGSTVTLTETPASGSVFAGWSGGGCSGAGTGCQVTMSAAELVTATFNIGPPQTLSVALAGSGSGSVSGGGVACPGRCSGAEALDSQVTLTETPTSGSVFAGWSGGGCSGVGASCQVTMSAAESVTARFNTGSPQTLSVGSAGSGSGSISGGGLSCPGTCSGPEGLDTEVTLTETPATGSVFVAWSGGCFGTGSTCQVTMTSAESVTATFNSGPSQSLFVGLEGSGSGSVSGGAISCPGTCSAPESQGSTVTLTETPASGSVFAGWSGGRCSGVGGSCQVTMSSAESVTAIFNAASVSGSGPSAQALASALGAVLKVTGRSDTTPALLKAGGYSFSFSAPVAGRLVLEWVFTPKPTRLERAVRSAHKQPKPVVIAMLSSIVRGGTMVRLKLELTGSGRLLLEHATARLVVTARATFTLTNGRATTKSRSITLRG